MKTSTTSVLALVLLIALAPLAHAEEDPVDLLRAAGTAESADRDLEKAMNLYLRVFTVWDEDSARATQAQWDAARDALIALARLQEKRGMGAEALVSLELVTERMGARLTDEQKRAVHEAMLRLLPPGGRARSPLGEVTKTAGSEGGALSPLDRKVDELLSQIDAAPGDSQARGRVTLLLYPLGAEVMPVLERVLYTARPERAQVAAEVYAQIGKESAVPGLARAVLEGDGFTRKAAVAGFETFRDLQRYTTSEVSPVLVPVLERLLADPRSATVRPSLVSLLARHLPAEALLERHARGGPEARWWLEQAFARRAPGWEDRALEIARGSDEEAFHWLTLLLREGRPAALPLALEKARAGGDEARRVVPVLVPLLFPIGGQTPKYSPESLDGPSRRSFLDLLLAAEHAWQHAPAIAELLAAIQGAEGEATVRERLVRAWRLLTRTTTPHENTMQHLAARRLEPPAALFEDHDWARTYFDLRGQGAFPASLLASSAFWDALFAVLPDLPSGKRLNLVWSFHQQSGMTLPAETNSRWLEVLDLAPFSSQGEKTPPPVLEAAARSGDPRYVAYVRAQTRGRQNPNEGLSVLQTLKEYRGPGLLEFLRELLQDPGLSGMYRQVAFDLLANHAGTEGRLEVERIALDWNHPSADLALATLNRQRPMKGLADVFRRAAETQEEIPANYLDRLIQVAGNLHLREAVPFLLRLYRDYPPFAERAGTTLDGIRVYHARISAFEAWSQEPVAGGGRELADLLRHADPEVRRAAVLALAALGRTDALPALVRLSADDPDPRVRKAALDAVERLSAD
jgi:hypothetical protein